MLAQLPALRGAAARRVRRRAAPALRRRRGCVWARHALDTLQARTQQVRHQLRRALRHVQHRHEALDLDARACGARQRAPLRAARAKTEAPRVRALASVLSRPAARSKLLLSAGSLSCRMQLKNRRYTSCAARAGRRSRRAVRGPGRGKAGRRARARAPRPPRLQRGVRVVGHLRRANAEQVAQRAPDQQAHLLRHAVARACTRERAAGWGRPRARRPRARAQRRALSLWRSRRGCTSASSSASMPPAGEASRARSAVPASCARARVTGAPRSAAG
jgi:hypothetical protein